MSGFDETFDFVVVGSGAGALSAALYQRSVGRSVVVLEKTDLIGGSTARSGGVMWIPNNRFMKQDGVPDSYEQARTYLDSVIGNPPDAPGATPARRHAYLTEAPRLIEFLVSQGIRLRRVPLWPDYYDDRPGGCESSRCVVAQLFDTNKLSPEWRPRLRPTLMPYPANIDDLMKLSATLYISWATRLLMLRVGIGMVWDRVLGRRMTTSGAALQGWQLHSVLQAGGDVRIKSPVTELIVANGAVAGVVTTRDGKPWRIGARSGVLVGAGGFAHNQRMRDRYQPNMRAENSLTPQGDTGEMIEEMMRHGAAIAQMSEFVGNQQTHPPGFEKSEFKPGAQSITAKPHCILVDQSGVRYMNEGGSYMAYCKGMLERNQTVPALPSYAILDSQYMRKYTLAGAKPRADKPQSWYDSGYLRRAATIEELARQLKMDPAQLAGTVERFNSFVARGHDDDFNRGVRAYDRWLGDPYHKPNGTLGAISEAPYYAVPVVPGDVSTYGGVVTDEHARVLRADGSVINGLYATGVSTASVMGPVYPGAGASIGPSITFGYIASQHAAAQR
jgi:3-oxosteroid 1-dehydrogenase